MKKFVVEEGLVMPLDRANVDTDFIIPKQFLKSIKRSGFGVNLFDEHRYLDKGVPDADNSNRPLNPDFVLNQARYQECKILLARKNFGCGSSREHAPWALDDYGFRVILAPSFADIFFNNCFKNGILPIIVSEGVHQNLMKDAEVERTSYMKIDLENQKIIRNNEDQVDFEVDEFKKYCLLNGLDDIGLTLQKSDKIRGFEKEYSDKFSWA